MRTLLLLLLVSVVVGMTGTNASNSVTKDSLESEEPRNSGDRRPSLLRVQSINTLENNTSGLHLGLSNTLTSIGIRKHKNGTDEDSAELRKKPQQDSAGVPGTIFNIPILGNPVLQVQPPDLLEIVSAGKPTVQFIQQPGIEIQPIIVPNEIPIGSKPEIEFSTGPSTLYQIPLLPHISIPNPLTSLFGNNFTLTGLLKPKPLKPLLLGLFGGGAGGNGKPNKPKPLYVKIVNAINKIHRKILAVTGLGSVMPNSTMISDKVTSVIKVLMMDTPF